MPDRNAHPDRYAVERIGTQDPEDSAYFVVDLVHDFDARVAVAKLGQYYAMRGEESKSKRTFEALHATQEAHAAAVAKRNALTGAKEKKGAKQAAR